MSQSSNYILLVLLLSATCIASKLTKLPALNINLVGTTVSGISSGGMMSAQFHTAYSSFVKGSAIIAGSPVGCTRGYLSFSTTECMASPQDLNMNMVNDAVNTINKQKKIDDISNLKGSQVYIFAGTKDTVVHPGSGVHAAAQFTQFEANVKTVFDIPAQHSYVTDQFGNVCDYDGSPYINNCNYNQAYDSLNYLLGGNLKKGTKALLENLIEFDQNTYSSNLKSSMYSSGYVYIPTNCADGKKQCRLHINFHGCLQSAEILKLDYIQMIGINDVAEANDIIVLYPQISKSAVFPFNPNGCWDWWGYSEWNALLVPSGYYVINSAGLNYLTKDALQISAVWSMATDLSSGNKKSSNFLSSE